MFRRLHKDKKSCKMDDPRHIGISKLNFAFGLVFGIHGYQLSVINRPSGRLQTNTTATKNSSPKTDNPCVTSSGNPVRPRIDSTSRRKCASVRQLDPP